jgi:hypothetical protein
MGFDSSKIALRSLSLKMYILESNLSNFQVKIHFAALI